MAVGKCDKHGYLIGKIKLLRSDTGMFFACKTVSFGEQKDFDRIKYYREQYDDYKRGKARRAAEKADEERRDEPGADDNLI